MHGKNRSFSKRNQSTKDLPHLCKCSEEEEKLPIDQSSVLAHLSKCDFSKPTEPLLPFSHMCSTASANRRRYISHNKRCLIPSDSSSGWAVTQGKEKHLQKCQNGASTNTGTLIFHLHLHFQIIQSLKLWPLCCLQVGEMSEF